MRDFQSIGKQIQERNYPYWKLYVKEGFKDNFIDSNFDNENIDSSAGLKMLESTVSMYSHEPGTVFCVELAKTSKSNGAGKTEKIPFVSSLDAYQANKDIPKNSEQPGFSGLGAVVQQQNLLSEMRSQTDREYYTKMLEIQSEKNKVEREREKIEEEKKKIALYKKKLKALHGKFTNRAEQIKSGIGKYAEKIFADMVGEDNPQDTLEGVKTEVQTETQTEQEMLIESIAENIHAKVTDLNDLKAIGLIAQEFIQNPELFNSYREKARNLHIKKAS